MGQWYWCGPRPRCPHTGGKGRVAPFKVEPVEQRGYVLIADITGYTSYLSRSELEHAQGTLTDLLGLLVEHTRPPLAVSRLEGDAVISYALEDHFVSAQTFIEAIEDTYIAFRRAIELMVLNNTCQCNACANVSSLDLKFFIHHGSFIIQSIGNQKELMGSDIILIHRLLKNTVTEATGFRAYVLCTDVAEQALGLENTAETMVRHQETVDDFGEVTVWVKDMHPVFHARKEEEMISYDPEEVIATFETEISMPPELVWDYLNQSESRDILMASERHEVLERKEGRVAPGTIYQCYHGKQTFPQVVLEWRPFERVVLKQIAPVPGGPIEALGEFRLTPVDGERTRLTQTILRPTGPVLGRAVFRTMMLMMRKQGVRDIEAFRDHIESDLASRRSAEITLSPVSPDQIMKAAAASLQTPDD